MQVSYNETLKRRDGFHKRIGELKREKDMLNQEDDRFKIISGHVEET